MNFPDHLLYTKDHELIKIDGTTGVVGITEFAQRELGDIVYIEVETVGQTITQGDIFGTVEAVKTVSDLFIPVTGKIMEFNSLLESNPELVNSDPYGEGWIVKIELVDSTKVKSLLTSEEYRALVE